MIFRENAETFLFEMSYNLPFFTTIYDFYSKNPFVWEIAAGVMLRRSLGAGQFVGLKG